MQGITHLLVLLCNIMPRGLTLRMQSHSKSTNENNLRSCRRVDSLWGYVTTGLVFQAALAVRNPRVTCGSLLATC